MNNQKDRKELMILNVTLCRKSFKKKDDMMAHRLEDHFTRVKPCRDGGNCTRQKCWYKHTKVTNGRSVEKEGDRDGWVKKSSKTLSSSQQQNINDRSNTSPRNSATRNKLIKKPHEKK